MEEIKDTEFKVVGERYRSFFEFYQVNDHRRLNALYAETGDGAADGIFEVADGVMFGPEQTKEALLYGTDLYHERFEEAKLGAQKILHDKYEFLEEPHVVSDLHGQHVVVERHVLGHPKSFARKKPLQLRRRSVKVLYDAMCPASTPLETRIEAGCSVLAAVDALEQVGYEVELSFVLAKYSGSNVVGEPTLMLEIPLKAYGERILPAKTEFPLASKSMLFHVGCFWAHRFPRTPINYGPGEGYPLSYDKLRLERMNSYAEKQHAAYISEDVVELKLESSPVAVLEHIVTGMGEEKDLLAHLRGVTPLATGLQPDQGKMFMGWGDDPSSDGIKPHQGSKDDEEADLQQQNEPNLDAQDLDGEDERSGQDLIDDFKPAGQSFGEEDDNREKQGNFEEESEETQMTGEDGFKTSLVGDELNSEEDSNPEESPSLTGKNNAPTRSQRSGESPAEGEEGSEISDENDGHGKGNQSDHDSSGEGETSEIEGSGDKKSTGENPIESTDQSEIEEEGENQDTSKKVEESEQEGEGMGMQDKNENGDLDFAQITKAMEDEIMDADPELGQEPEEFVIMLRRRYMMFEQGDYLNMMISQKMAKRRAKKEEEKLSKEESSPLKPPVMPDAPTIDDVKFGAPRNTPFSMTNIPHKK